MIRRVTDSELKSAVEVASEMANELNKMFAETSMRELLRTGKVAFVYHPEVINGNLGEDYKQGTIAWAQGGALEQLMMMLDKDVPGAAPEFGYGMLGSVWFDADLTGGHGAARRTKKVRVTPMKDRDGNFNIMLDNTFEFEW